MSVAYDPREPWNPIEFAPRDGTKVLLLFRSGFVDLGRWQHSVRTVNGKVECEFKGWQTHGMSLGLGGDKSEPFMFALIPGTTGVIDNG